MHLAISPAWMDNQSIFRTFLGDGETPAGKGFTLRGLYATMQALFVDCTTDRALAACIDMGQTYFLTLERCGGTDASPSFSMEWRM
jgi:hypothetical protein